MQDAPPPELWRWRQRTNNSILSIVGMDSSIEKGAFSIGMLSRGVGTKLVEILPVLRDLG